MVIIIINLYNYVIIHNNCSDLFFNNQINQSLSKETDICLITEVMLTLLIQSSTQPRF